MKNIFFTTLILIVLISGFNCNEDFPFDEFRNTVITTKPVDIITDSGIIAKAEFIGDFSRVTEYGFIWDQDRGNLTIDNTKKVVFKETPVLNFVEININHSLLPNEVYYLRAFAVTENIFVSGNIVIFKSKGISAPIINSISKNYGSIGEEVIIYGDNFINNFDTASIILGEVSANTNNITNTEISVTIPLVPFQTHDLSVRILGKTSSVSFTVLDNWSDISDFPGERRSGAVSFVISDYAYVGCGNNSNYIFNDLWRYDPVLNIWSRIADFPGEPRNNLIAFELDGKGYIGLGEKYPIYYQDLWKYDPLTNSWEQINNFPANMYKAVSFVINSSAYIGLGGSKEFWKYSSESDSWEKTNNYPGNTDYSATSFTIDNYAYVGTGNYSGNKEFFKFNVVNEDWEQITDFPEKITDGISFSLNEYGYVGYGKFWKYISSTNKWVQTSDFYQRNRYSSVSFKINGRGYAGLGYYWYNSNKVFCNDFKKFNPNPTPEK